KNEEKAALIEVLKSHKPAIAWKLSDIKGPALIEYTDTSRLMCVMHKARRAAQLCGRVAGRALGVRESRQRDRHVSGGDQVAIYREWIEAIHFCRSWGNKDEQTQNLSTAVCIRD
ncbi:hypothetical protein Tco_1062249, partial [Tanacetum coccineum]